MRVVSAVVSCWLVGSAVVVDEAAGDDLLLVRTLTVDHEHDVLVEVNLADGSVSEVGPLGVDVGFVDLAVFDGRLYALDSGTESLSITLFEIDAATGAATALADLSAPGVSIEFAEWLTADAEGLIVGVDLAPNGGVRSLTHGRLEVDGTVTPIATALGTTLGDNDIDFGEYDPETELLFVGNADFNGGDYRVLYGVMDLGGTVVQQLGNYPPTELGGGSVLDFNIFGDRAVGAGARFTPSGGEGCAVCVFDRVGNSFALDRVVFSDPGREYSGIALVQEACPCDADSSGVVDIADLLLFLADWFVSGATVEVLLDFLSCWFPAQESLVCG